MSKPCSAVRFKGGRCYRPSKLELEIKKKYPSYKKVEKLIAQGENVNNRSTYHAPLTIAAQKGHLEIGRLLIKHGAMISNDAIRGALMHGDHHVFVEQLLNNQVEVPFCEIDTEEVDRNLAKHGVTNFRPSGSEWIPYNIDIEEVISAAAAYGRCKTLRVLLRSSLAYKSSFNPLIDTVFFHPKKGIAPVVKILIKHGFDPRKKDWVGESALSIAQKEGKAELVAFFKKGK